MEFVDWVKELAPKPHDLGYRFPEASPPAQIRAQRDDTFLPEAPESTRNAPARAADRAGITGHFNKTARLDQINVAIDYCDANGVRTRRPITIMEIGDGGGKPVINALCHMRGEVRTFRIDRIASFITQDGEVIEPATYIRDAFNIDLKIFAKLAPDSDDPLIEARKVRDALRPMLTLLVLMARVDGEYHRNELDAILIYAEKELLELEKLGQMPAALTIPMLDQLTKVVRQMRPNILTVEYYVSRIGHLNPPAQTRFWKAVRAVMFADGRFAEQEWEFEAMIEKFRAG